MGGPGGPKGERKKKRSRDRAPQESIREVGAVVEAALTHWPATHQGEMVGEEESGPRHHVGTRRRSRRSPWDGPTGPGWRTGGGRLSKGLRGNTGK